MGRYHRLTQAERYQIEGMLHSEMSIRSIAKALNRSPGTLSREVRRNKVYKDYRAEPAQRASLKRRCGIGPHPKIIGDLAVTVANRLSEDLSPQQISGELKLLGGPRVSHETIYKYVYADKELWKHLRRKRRTRRPRGEFRRKYDKYYDRRPIKERPLVVEQRSRLGDFERDTMECKKGSSLLLTIVDRTSRLTKIRLIERKNATLIHEATVEALEGLTVHTITNDNGPEFSMHYFTSQALQADIFFSRPYASWERGTNENTNGLIRQYFPLGSELNPDKVQEVEDRLNNRPRKCLGYRTPLQVHRDQSGVALGS